MNLTITHFAVRNDATLALAEMTSRVTRATGCPLEEGEYHKIPGMRGKLLGMDVGLYEWGGPRGRMFRFEGEVEDPAFLDFTAESDVDITALDISQAVADVLTVMTGSPWRLPDSEDFAAERAYGDEVERRFSESS